MRYSELQLLTMTVVAGMDSLKLSLTELKPPHNVVLMRILPRMVPRMLPMMLPRMVPRMVPRGLGRCGGSCA